MKLTKYKHLTFEDRCTIQEYLNFGYNFTQIGNRIGKSRRTISKEIYKHRFMRSNTKSSNINCYIIDKPPYVCNACTKKNSCSKQRYSYEASVAHNEYLKTLIEQRSVARITKEQIISINDVISPLMIHKHHSVNQVYITHPELLPFSKSTFYRYIDLGLLNVKNIDLQRKVRFKVKKEYDRTKTKINTSIKVGRFYTDFKDYLEYHPNCSWQKGSIEKNHEYIRYILPKGSSFSGLTQEECNLIASHINSVPRKSLNNISPYEASINFIGKQNIEKLNIKKIEYDDIDLSIRLLKK